MMMETGEKSYNELAEMIDSYYGSLSQFQWNDIADILECIESQVNVEQNEQLTQEFTANEVKRDIFCMQPDKSPCTNGMNLVFYQRF